jgi:purine-binding chemotaxis protein CheW
MKDRVSEAGGNQGTLAKTLSILTFCINGQVFGLPVTAVNQLIEMVAITPIPEAPLAIRGVINVHGEIVPVMDLRLRLGLSFKPYQLRTPIILLQANGRTLALVVDEMQSVVDVNPVDTQTGESVFDFVTAENSHQPRFFSSIARVNKQIITILDADHLASIHLETQLTPMFAPQTTEHPTHFASEKQWTGV